MKNTHFQAAMAQSIENVTAVRKVPGSGLGHSLFSLVKIQELVRVVNGSKKILKPAI